MFTSLILVAAMSVPTPHVPYVCTTDTLYTEECDPGNIGETITGADRATTLKLSAPLKGAHTVKRGDTLGALARRYGYPGGAAALARDNGIADKNRIRVGQVLVVSRVP